MSKIEYNRRLFRAMVSVSKRLSGIFKNERLRDFTLVLGIIAFLNLISFVISLVGMFLLGSVLEVEFTNGLRDAVIMGYKFLALWMMVLYLIFLLYDYLRILRRDLDQEDRDGK